MSDYKAVKFDLNKPIKVILAFDEPLTSQSKKYNKTNYWYGIKELITGENGFNATEKLHETIQGLNKKKGDEIIINKVNNGSFTFFTVDDNQLTKNDPKTNTTGGDVLMKDIKPEVPLEARVNTLEEEVAKLRKQLSELPVQNNATKTSDEDIPF
tara:strand:- start:5093 stop:5557 length:465 start_codon:yes stop_codon:yes gene_type:complete